MLSLELHFLQKESRHFYIHFTGLADSLSEQKDKAVSLVFEGGKEEEKSGNLSFIILLSIDLDVFSTCSFGN